MSDGGDLGITADAALKAVFGSDVEEKSATPEEVMHRVQAASPDSYSGAADCIARALLRLYEQNEDALDWPASPEYHWQLPDGSRPTAEQEREIWSSGNPFAEGEPVYGAKWVASGPDLYNEVKTVAEPDELKALEDSTGFMWGFAVNTARWLCDEAPVSNPALVSI